MRSSPARPAGIRNAALAAAVALLCLGQPACSRGGGGSNAAARGSAPSDLRPPARPGAPEPVDDGFPLGVKDVSFAGPAGHREPPEFSRGETVVCLFSVSGFLYRDGRGKILADLEVKREGKKELLLSLPDTVVLDGPAPTKHPGTIRLAASLQLDPAAPPGKDEVEIALHDLSSGRRGAAEGAFELLGPAEVAREAALSISGLRLVADQEVPPGEPVPVAFEVRGAKTRERPAPAPVAARRAPERRLDLGVSARLLSESGKVLSSRDESLASRRLLFVPSTVPVEYVVEVPPSAPPGPVVLELEVDDLAGGGRARGSLPFRVAPARGLAIVNPHVHDAARLPRSGFLLGEAATVRLSVYGLASVRGRSSGTLDFAIGGPGGVYVAHKDAVAIKEGPGRFPIQIPFTLPSLAPVGRYKVVLRVRDLLARREATRELPLRIEGKPLSFLSSLTVDALEVREREDLPLLPGDTFVAGKSYLLEVRAGGAKLEEVRRQTFRARLEGGLRLFDLAGNLVHESARLFRYDRETTYQPLRILIAARWQTPLLPPGLYDLDVSLLNKMDDRVSEMRKRVEIVAR
jgi:hypothetical protein